jgi:hypothetical protein
MAMLIMGGASEKAQRIAEIIKAPTDTPPSPPPRV